MRCLSDCPLLYTLASSTSSSPATRAAITPSASRKAIRSIGGSPRWGGKPARTSSAAILSRKLGTCAAACVGDVGGSEGGCGDGGADRDEPGGGLGGGCGGGTPRGWTEAPVARKAEVAPEPTDPAPIAMVGWGISAGMKARRRR